MTDKIEIKEGKIILDMHYILDYLDDATQAELFKIAAFKEHLADFVVGHILNDCCYEEDWYIGNLGQKLRMKLTPMMDEIARTAIKTLIIKVKTAQKEADRQRRYAHSMNQYANNLYDFVVGMFAPDSKENKEYLKLLRDVPPPATF